MKKLCLLLVFCTPFAHAEVIDQLIPAKPIAFYQQEKDQIHIEIDQYALADQAITGNRKKKSVQEGFYPLEITVENKSDKSCVLHPTYVDLDIMNISQATSLIRSDSTVGSIFKNGTLYSGILTGGGIALTAFTPTIFFGPVAIMSGLTLFLGTCLYGLPIGLACDGASSVMNRNSLKKSLLHTTTVIRPGDTRSTYILVPESAFNSRFTLNVAQTEQKNIKRKSLKALSPSSMVSFDINLKQKGSAYQV